MSSLLDPDRAEALVREACTPLPPENVASADAMGRTLARAVTSPVDLPPFHNSAMDGYALSGGDAPLAAGSEWPVEGEQAAGQGASRAGAGACWAIMTGARLPDGLDRVIPVERTTQLDDPPRVRLEAEVARWQNIRKAGTDVAGGDTVLAAGTTLAPQHLMLLAALGIAQVPVVQRPRVAVLSTGRELVDDPATPLAPGQIRDSNGPFLAERVPRAGAELVHAESLGDQVKPFLAAIKRARDAGAQVIVSTGAVSMGRYDFVPQALEALGADIVYHKLAVRPGKPQLFARLSDGTLFFGLPGNPIATAVGMRFFVERALRVMLGLPRESPWRVPLAAGYAKKPPLRFHLKSRIGVDAEGRLHATVLPGQQSYRIRPLADANGWVVVPVDARELAAGALVDVYGLGHLQSPLIPSTWPS